MTKKLSLGIFDINLVLQKDLQDSNDSVLCLQKLELSVLH